MKNFLKLLIGILLLGGTFVTKAQTAELKLSLADALQKAEANNRQINKARKQGEAAKAEFRQTNSVFLPNVTLSHTAITTTDPLSAFGFKLKQEITSAADFNPMLLNNPDRIENYTTKVEVQQPLINLDGVFARKAASAKREAIDFKTQRTIFYTKFEVKKAYYRLELAQQAIKVYEKSVETAKSALKLTQNNKEQGYAKEADVLAAKVSMLDLQNKLADAKNNQKQASEFLAYMLGLPINTPLTTTNKLQHEPALLKALTIERDMGTRSDIMAYKKSLEARKNMLKSAKMKFLPRLNAFGTYELNDSKLFGTTAKNYMIGASLSWNIFGGGKNIGKMQHAKSETDIATLELADYQSKNNMQVEGAKRNIKVAFDRIELTRVAKEQADEAHRIRTNRYKQGLEKTIDLLQSESLSVLKNLEYINALYQYQVAVFQLELLIEKELN